MDDAIYEKQEAKGFKKGIMEAVAKTFAEALGMPKEQPVERDPNPISRPFRFQRGF